MLLTCMRMEGKKLRHSMLWLVFAVIPVIPTFMGAGNYMNNLDLLKSGWYSLWTQHSLFYANFFYGPLIAIYCAYLWRVEHLNHNWNTLMTMPVPVSNVFLAKLLLTFRCTVGLQLWVWVLFFISGKYTGLPGLPPAQIFVWLLRGALGGMVIAALQLFLSMVIRCFAVPIALALFGSIVGLMAANGGFGLCWPYSLMLMGMNANKQENMINDAAGFLISLCFFLLLFLSAAVLYLKKRDIKSA